jgi:hypothetical protein
MDAVLQLSTTVGIESACDALDVARASFYRQRPLLGPTLSAPLPAPPAARPTPARALGADELLAVRAVLNSERFQDCSPAAIHATEPRGIGKHWATREDLSPEWCTIDIALQAMRSHADSDTIRIRLV